MTLTQLSAFVLVARLGSVKAAAQVLAVSEPAVSQALTALRAHLGDQLAFRDGAGMTLTAGGSRLFPIAAKLVGLGAEAEAAVRAAQGAPARLRVVVSSPVAEFAVAPLLDAFTRRSSGAFETSSGVAACGEMRALVSDRLADVALGPYLGRQPELGLLSEPIFRYRVVVVASPRFRPRGGCSQWPWLVDPSGTDPHSDTSRLLRRLGVAEPRVRVFPNQTAAWAAAADGEGVAPALANLVDRQVRRGEFRVVENAAHAGTRMLARDDAGRRPRDARGQITPAFPRHARGDADHARARRRSTAITVPPTGLRHDLERLNHDPGSLDGVIAPSRDPGSWRSG